MAEREEPGPPEGVIGGVALREDIRERVRTAMPEHQLRNGSAWFIEHRWFWVRMTTPVGPGTKALDVLVFNAFTWHLIVEGYKPPQTARELTDSQRNHKDELEALAFACELLEF